MAHLRAACERDARSLGPRLREMDARECRVLGGKSPTKALLSGVRAGAAKTIIDDDGFTPIGMFGSAPTGLPGVGSAWLLASDDLVNNAAYRREFLRESPLWVLWMHTQHAVLFNLILEDNRIAIRWLKWLGFTFTPTAVPGVLMFRRFRHV